MVGLGQWCNYWRRTVAGTEASEGLAQLHPHFRHLLAVVRGVCTWRQRGFLHNNSGSGDSLGTTWHIFAGGVAEISFVAGTFAIGHVITIEGHFARKFQAFFIEIAYEIASEVAREVTCDVFVEVTCGKQGFFVA